MTFRNSLLPAVSRYAAGIDVGPHAVRLVVVSQRLRANGPLRIEAMVTVPLQSGVLAGIEIVNRQAVGRALREAFAQLAPAVARRLVRWAMAVPGTATLLSAHQLVELEHAARASLAGMHGPLRNDPALRSIESAVMLEAERVTGIERHALAVDWFMGDAACESGCVTIAAAGRQHLETRMECAAAAGITLTAVDGEPYAALRALHHAAQLELNAELHCAALWVGSDGVYGWRLVSGQVIDEIRYPAPEYGDLRDALRDLAHDTAFECALVAGEVALLDDAGLGFADIGDVLGCRALSFECASVAEPMPAAGDVFPHEPAFAVAFGLALRGVVE